MQFNTLLLTLTDKCIRLHNSIAQNCICLGHSALATLRVGIGLGLTWVGGGTRLPFDQLIGATLRGSSSDTHVGMSFSETFELELLPLCECHECWLLMGRPALCILAPVISVWESVNVWRMTWSVKVVRSFIQVQAITGHLLQGLIDAWWTF